MTDCTRFSGSQIKGREVWYIPEDKWLNLPLVQNSGAEACQNACVSEPGCKTWRYNHTNGVCDVSHHEVEDASATTDEYSSGRIRCVAEYDMLRIVIYSMMLAFIFVMWWYLTKPCRRR